MLINVKNKNVDEEDLNHIQEIVFEAQQRCIKDLLFVYHSKCYINEKGYLTKLIDKLHELGYYDVNETIFLKKGI